MTTDEPTNVTSLGKHRRDRNAKRIEPTTKPVDGEDQMYQNTVRLLVRADRPSSAAMAFAGVAAYAQAHGVSVEVLSDR